MRNKQRGGILHGYCTPRTGSVKFSLRVLEHAGDARRPFCLTRLIADEILANLNFNMQQRARLGVMRDGVVGLVADEVRFVVGDDQVPLAPQHP